jgi:CRISPR-associated endoribonuclease Cas6
MVKTSVKKSNSPMEDLTNWTNNSELVGLVFELAPVNNVSLFPDYAKGLHAWFLDQVRQLDPKLSASLHDDQTEKAFTISRLEGKIETNGHQLELNTKNMYSWYITGLSQAVINWMGSWLVKLPEFVNLRDNLLEIKSVEFFLPPTTYQELERVNFRKTLTLSFVSPTSFRRKGHHFPLPLPVNLFHSYLRRWLDFSGKAIASEAFLDWVDQFVIINRHQLESVKVAGGKKGTVTGFVGAIELSLANEANNHSEWLQLYSVLANFAPYCGTGHKTTFGLGQTRLGWHLLDDSIASLALEYGLASRIEELTNNLMGLQKRTGGDRALNVCRTRATILARQEFGESLIEIANDLEMPYETVKTYAKLARRGLR